MLTNLNGFYCVRSQETSGEDPYLTAELVRPFIRGLKGEHPRYLKVATGCKHFDVHGGPENIPISRKQFNAVVSTAYLL